MFRVLLLKVLFSLEILFTFHKTVYHQDLEDFLTLTIGHNPASPLPPPLSQQPSLQRAAILAVKTWHEKFGSAHKKLQLAFSALAGTVDFQELCLVSDPARLRRQEREERVARASSGEGGAGDGRGTADGSRFLGSW